VNVDTGEFRALTEQVEHLTGVVEDQQGLLIRTLAAALQVLDPAGSAGFQAPKSAQAAPIPDRHLRLVRGDAP
jgi:hypothetical protein